VRQTPWSATHAVKDMSLDIGASSSWIGCKEVNDETPKERDIAMVFQNTRLVCYFKASSSSRQARSQRRQACSQTRQCS